ncbi:MAG: 2Fe-2S iron-sulfur cluster-binding protein [Alphaproteobacteria bacterium]
MTASLPQPMRLREGGLINRNRPLTFTFDRRVYQGYEGDSLASALLASGVKLFGRSFKYHRPRGVFSAGPEEPSALVEIDQGKAERDPNHRAPTVELYDGLETFSQNHIGPLGLDLMEANDLISRFLPAGFYYKTFFFGGL